MAEPQQNPQAQTGDGLWSAEMEFFKVRMFTPKIPSNAVLVSENIFTKSRAVHTHAMVHMPWTRSRYISMKRQNLDLQRQKFEVNGEGYEVTTDLAVSYQVEPVQKAGKAGVRSRWRDFIGGFATKPLKSVLKALAMVGVTVAGGLLLGPVGVGLAIAGSAATVSFSGQDKDWVESQGAIKAAFDSTEATRKAELEQIVFREVREYYATHTWEESKNLRIEVDLNPTTGPNHPIWGELNRSLIDFQRDFGVRVNGIRATETDLPERINELLQKQKEAQITARNTEIQATADATARRTMATADAEADLLYIQTLMAQAPGTTLDQAYEQLRIKKLAESGNTIFTGNGGVLPTINIDSNQNQSGRGRR